MSAGPASRPDERPTTPARQVLVGLMALIIAIVAFASPAAAHADLERSDPEAGATLDAPVTEVRLTFTAGVTPAADEFSIDGPGGPVAVAAVANDGEQVLVVTPAEPLSGGAQLVTWAIRSDDTHSITGSVAFTVADGPAVSVGDTPTTLPGSTEDIAPGRKALGAERVATVGRWLVYLALLFCVGGLAYLQWVHRGPAWESRRLVFHVRRAAVVLLVGAGIEWLAQVAVLDQGSLGAVASPSAWGDLAGETFGRGTALRLVGAALVLGFLRVQGGSVVQPVGRDDLPSAGTEGSRRSAVAGADLTRVRVLASPVAVLGAALLVLSEMFLGHTATVGPRLVVLVGDAGHLVGAAAWSAGAAMLALTLRARARHGVPLDARLLATRFSVVAAWALVVVTVTGVVLSWSILDGVGALWGSEFGRLLLAKVAVVAVIAVIGGYNRQVLVPLLERPPVDGSTGTDEQFRRTVLVEVLLFVAVLALTATLVAANPT